MKDKNQSDESKIKIALEYCNDIIAILREPFLVLDKNLRVIFATQTFYAIFEVVEKDTIGWLLPDLGNRQWNIPKLLELLKEILPEKKVVKDYEIEHKFEHIGERVMILNACQLRVPREIAATIAKEEEKELILLAIEDITGRKQQQQQQQQQQQADEALRESEGKFIAIFNAAFQFIGLMTPDGMLIEANKAAVDFTGVKQEDILNRPFWETPWWRGNEERVQKLKESIRLAASGKFVRYEVELQGAGDTTAIFDFSIKPVFGLDGKVTLLVPEGRDITELKQREMEIGHLYRQNALVLNSAGEGILGLDLKGNQTFVNSAAAKMLGYEAEELIGRHSHTMWHHTKSDGSPYPKEECPIYAVLMTGAIRHKSDEVFWRKDGTSFPAEFLSTPVREQGKTVGVVVTFKDITERKKMEEEERKHVREMEIFYKASKGREERIFELKKEIEQLKKEMGK